MELLGNRLHDRKELPGGPRGVTLRLVIDPLVYPERQSVGWGWREVACEVARDDPRAVARFLFGLQVRHDDSFFLEHQPSAPDACVAADPAAVWQEPKEILDTKNWARLAIGFPANLLSELPHSAVISGVDEDPKERAGIVAHFVDPTFAHDQDLDAQLVERYGEDRNVRSGLFSNLVSGTSVGSIADKWKGLAQPVRLR
jgi:hypothetical protein